MREKLYRLQRLIKADPVTYPLLSCILLNIMFHVVIVRSAVVNGSDVQKADQWWGKKVTGNHEGSTNNYFHHTNEGGING